MKPGVFYGVGVGSGDPELMTLKAVRVLERCPVIAAPQTRGGRSLALDIAARTVSMEGKVILPLYFTMGRDTPRRRKAHKSAVDEIACYLAVGRDVAMPNLGDVSIYASCCYFMELLREEGFETVMVPGVPSFCTAAARLGSSLTEMDAPLHVIPAGAVPLENALALPGTKILMKAGGRLPEVAAALRERNLLKKSAMVCNCGLPGEEIYPTMEQASETAGYFSTIIVKE